MGSISQHNESVNYLACLVYQKQLKGEREVHLLMKADFTKLFNLIILKLINLKAGET